MYTYLHCWDLISKITTSRLEDLSLEAMLAMLRPRTGYNFVEPAKLRRWSTGPRIVKYKSRGFGTVFFEICKHHPRCDLPSTLDEETARRIAALNGFVSASQDLGYGEVELPFVQRMLLGMHLDQYMEQHEDRRKSIRQSIDFQSKGLWNLPDSDLVAGKYRYISGDESASETSIETLLSVNMEKDGLPGLRWKNVDLWESRRGNEFLTSLLHVPRAHRSLGDPGRTTPALWCLRGSEPAEAGARSRPHRKDGDRDRRPREHRLRDGPEAASHGLPGSRDHSLSKGLPETIQPRERL